jgi:hypothetical protein
VKGQAAAVGSTVCSAIESGEWAAETICTSRLGDRSFIQDQGLGARGTHLIRGGMCMAYMWAVGGGDAETMLARLGSEFAA